MESTRESSCSQNKVDKSSIDQLSRTFFNLRAATHMEAEAVQAVLDESLPNGLNDLQADGAALHRSNSRATSS